MSVPEGIPRNLAIIVQRLSQYQAQHIKIAPMNTSTFGPGSVCSIRLPAYKVIDTHSLQLAGTFTASCKTATKRASLPGFGAGIIQRITVSCNGVAIGSGCTNYNEVIAMLDNLTMGESKRREMGIYENYWDLGAAGAAATYNNATDQGGAAAAWAVNSFHGTLLGGTHQRFIDTGALGSVQLDIQFAQPVVLASEDTLASTSFQLTDVALYAKTIDFGNGLYSAMIQKKVNAGGLVIPFKNYVTALSSASAGGQDHVVHVGSQCIDQVWSMFKDSTYTSTQGAYPSSTQGHLSTYFRTGNRGTATRFNLVINNTTLPAFPVDSVSAYYMLKSAMNGIGKNLLYVNGCKDNYDWLANKFVFTVGLEHPVELGEVGTLSGLDTLANPFPITVRVQNADGPHTAIIVVECTSQCIVNPGQVIGYLQ